MAVTTERVQEDIATFAKRFDPGTVKLFIGISGAGKSTLAYRVAESTSAAGKRVAFVCNEGYAIESLTRRAEGEIEQLRWEQRNMSRARKREHEDQLQRALERKAKLFHADPYTVPEGVDLAATDLLVMGQAHRTLTNDELAALRAHLQEHPQLAILIWGTMPRWAVTVFERMAPEAWHERAEPVALDMDAFAIVKPAGGWNFREGPGPQQVHFLTPERCIVEIPEPTRRAW